MNKRKIDNSKNWNVVIDENSLSCQTFAQLFSHATQNLYKEINALRGDRTVVSIGQIMQWIQAHMGQANKWFEEGYFEEAFIEYFLLQNIDDLFKQFPPETIKKFKQQLRGLKAKSNLRFVNLNKELKKQYEIKNTTSKNEGPGDIVAISQDNKLKIHGLENGSVKINKDDKVEQIKPRSESLSDEEINLRSSTLSLATITHKYVGEKRIDKNKTGISYRKIFCRCLDDTITTIEVVDPYIIVDNQVNQFIVFCSLVIEYAPNLNKITLLTKREGDNAKWLNIVKDDLAKETNVELKVEFTTEDHDREIIFDNGWKVRIGRGLDIFQTAKPFTLGSCNQKYLKCRKTLIEYFKSEQ